MIQRARNNISVSLFREAEYATIVLDNPEKEAYFEQLSVGVVRKRKNPNKLYTGAKELRTQFLATLKQLGDVQTVNVWARKLIIEPETIESLRTQIEATLRKNRIYGVAEIHLQDYEINSTHIQFVGTQAEEAERLIADIVVRLGYEDSLAAAVGKKMRQELSETPRVPAPSPRVPSKEATSLDDLAIDVAEEIKTLQNLRDKYMDNVMRKIGERTEQILQQFRRKKARDEGTKTLLERYNRRKEKE